MVVRRTFLLVAAAAGLLACRTTAVHDRAGGGEARGLYLTGFEVSSFHPCGTAGDSLIRVAVDSAARAILAEHRAAARTTELVGQAYDTYEVRWVMRAVPLSASLDRAGVITSRPRFQVVRVVSVAAPTLGRCEFGELRVGAGAPAP